MRYEHTQKGKLHLILLGVALISLSAGGLGFVVDGRAAPFIIVLAVAGVLLLFATCFRQLTVRDEGDRLAARFGPLPLFSVRIPYADITSVEVAKSSWLDGWGVHWMPGHGWIYNLWGFDCVEIRRGRKTTRVGTDEPDALAAFIRTKLPAPEPQ